MFSSLTTRGIKDLTQSGIRFIFNTPNEISLQGYLKLGWSVVSRWPITTRNLDKNRDGEDLLAERKPISQDVGWDDVFCREVTPWKTFLETYFTECDALIRGWENSRTRVGFRTPRDLNYLAWRYGGHPYVKYAVYASTDDKGLAGFAILRPEIRYQPTSVSLLDMFLRETCMELGSHFVKTLMHALRADYLVSYFAEGTFEHTLLKHMGFRRSTGAGRTFVVHTLNSTSLDPLQAGSWDLTSGDLEVF